MFIGTIGDMDSNIMENIKHDFIKNDIYFKFDVDLNLSEESGEKRIQNLIWKMEIKILLII